MNGVLLGSLSGCCLKLCFRVNGTFKRSSGSRVSILIDSLQHHPSLGLYRHVQFCSSENVLSKTQIFSFLVQSSSCRFMKNSFFSLTIELRNALECKIRRFEISVQKHYFFLSLPKQFISLNLLLCIAYVWRCWPLSTGSIETKIMTVRGTS